MGSFWVHSERVAEWTYRLCKLFSLSWLDTIKLVLAAMLHDVGKYQISKNIIHKSTNLTNQEYILVQQHPELGERITNFILSKTDIPKIIRHHHERWDGYGYPDGLKDSQIPFGSRIIAVCDAFDAMISNREYRASKTISEALDELVLCAGKQFDPVVISMFIILFKIHEPELPILQIFSH